MRKITLVLLSFVCLCSIHAQDVFEVGPTGSTGYTGSTQMQQDNTTGDVGIGVGSNITTTNAALAIGNVTFSTPPQILFGVANMLPGSTLGPANSYFSMASLRMDTSFTLLAFDFALDNNGLLGLGAPSAYFNFLADPGYTGTHLDVIDPDPSGTIPLLSVATNTNNPTGYNLAALTVDYRGYTSLGGYFPDATNPAHLFIYDPNPSGTDALLQVQTNANTPSLYVASSGYVGIGESYALANAHLTLTDPNASGTDPLLNVVTNSSNSNISALFVNAAGSVGIGTASPVSAMDVNGGISVGTYAGASAAPSNGMIISGQVGIGSTSPPTGVLLDVQGGVVRIGNVSTPNQMLYSGTGSGTTGTDINGYGLYVQYGVLAESFKCAAYSSGSGSFWTDYVFDKDYKLKSLSEVESYIAKNHHLPDVPSTEDVECEGIDMAHMDATLLKKIEELTLYVLDLKKDNEAIKKDNAAMKAEITNLKK